MGLYLVVGICGRGVICEDFVTFGWKGGCIGISG